MAVPHRLAILVIYSGVVTISGACSGPAPAAPDPTVRIVSLHDVTTEIVVALGATDRLVGVAETVDIDAKSAAAIARVPRVGYL